METNPHPGSLSLFPALPASNEGLRDTAIAALHELASRYTESGGAWELRFLAANVLGTYRRVEAEAQAEERRAAKRLAKQVGSA